MWQSLPKLSAVLEASRNWFTSSNPATGEEIEKFKLGAIKEKFQARSNPSAGGPEWKSFLKVGFEDFEVEELEACLAGMACSSEYDLRHDFSFYTPTCRDVRVKVCGTWTPAHTNY